MLIPRLATGTWTAWPSAIGPWPYGQLQTSAGGSGLVDAALENPVWQSGMLGGGNQVSGERPERVGCRPRVVMLKVAQAPTYEY